MEKEKKYLDLLEKELENLSEIKSKLDLKTGESIEEWSNCSICSVTLKSINLSNHLEKVHSKTEKNLLKQKNKINKEKKHKKEHKFDKNIRYNNVKEFKIMIMKQGRQRNLLVGVLLVSLIVLIGESIALTAPFNKDNPDKSGEIFQKSENNKQEDIKTAKEVTINEKGEKVLSSEGKEDINNNKTRAPDFYGIDVMSGQNITLNQFQGSSVVLNFVNYGCSADINYRVSKQLLNMKNLTEEREDFKPISVFCGCCPEETLKNFAQENNFTWSWILDSDYSIISKYAEYVQIFDYPTLIFIDKDQNIRDATGLVDQETLSSKIDETLR